MKTMQCRDCKGIVSKRAKTCPHCGAPVQQASTGGGCLVVILVVGGFIWWNASNGNKNSPSPASTQPTQTTPQITNEDVTKRLDGFLALLKLADVTLVDSVSVNYQSGQWIAKITVKNIWHLRHKQLRLQDAQSLWKGWASIASPNELDSARISLVDHNDNEVGGSRILAGSLIWVQD